MESVSQIGWDLGMIDPSGERNLKPRNTGLTMIIDKGLGLRAYEDMLGISAPFIDIIKLGFGTSLLYPGSVLEQKIQLAKQHKICVIPGGTFLELAVAQGCAAQFLDNIGLLGFDGMEVSDGTIEMERRTRNQLIAEGTERGFTVFTEYGKKAWGSRMDWEDFTHTVYMDLQVGASLITVEGRESGMGVGIYDEQGDCDHDVIAEQMSLLDHPERILFEAPLKHQQVDLIRILGRNVNLGNVSPDDVLSLECLRRGLRSDTFKF